MTETKGKFKCWTDRINTVEEEEKLRVSFILSGGFSSETFVDLRCSLCQRFQLFPLLPFFLSFVDIIFHSFSPLPLCELRRAEALFSPNIIRLQAKRERAQNCVILFIMKNNLDSCLVSLSSSLSCCFPFSLLFRPFPFESNEWALAKARK